MVKNEPTEKEKLLRRLTEKEIRDQLYGFNSGHRPPQTQEPLPREKEEPAAPKEERKAQQSVGRPVRAKAKRTFKIVVPKRVIQAALILAFLALSAASVRYIARFAAARAGQPKRQSAVKKSYTAKPKDLKAPARAGKRGR